MPERLKADDIAHFEHALRDRLAALRSQLALTLSQLDEESYGKLAGHIYDVDDEAFADLVCDVKHADFTRELNELRGLNAALRRIHSGTYGVCVGCGEPIDRQRLEAHPSATRCLDCQRATEQASPSMRTPRL